uniref:Rho-GAP domain-containing protein n=2 Tax=Bursaphelenchus xylophilus TaxID=6326 RepID=A0A1I7S6Y7_BURXY
MCLIRGLYTDDLTMENVAAGIIRYYLMFVITDLGYAIRIGSERSAFYPIPETATTHIHAKKALKSEDTESLLYMVLGMMAPLPWAGMKKLEEVTKTKLECTDENSIPDEFFDIKEAVTLCLMRGLYTDDLTMENVAAGIIRYYLSTVPLHELHLPVRFPSADVKLVSRSSRMTRKTREDIVFF